MILVKMDIYEKLLAEKSLDELLEDARIWKNGREKNEYKVNYEVMTTLLLQICFSYYFPPIFFTNHQ